MGEIKVTCWSFCKLAKIIDHPQFIPECYCFAAQKLSHRPQIGSRVYQLYFYGFQVDQLATIQPANVLGEISMNDSAVSDA